MTETILDDCGHRFPASLADPLPREAPYDHHSRSRTIWSSCVKRLTRTIEGAPPQAFPPTDCRMLQLEPTSIYDQRQLLVATIVDVELVRARPSGFVSWMNFCHFLLSLCNTSLGCGELRDTSRFPQTGHCFAIS